MFYDTAKRYRNLLVAGGILHQTKSKKGSMGNYEYVPGSTNRSYVRLNTGLRPVRGVLPGHITYQDEFATTHTFTGNTCSMACLYAVGTANHWTKTVDLTAGFANLDIEGYAPWFNLNPETGVAAGPIIAAKTSTGTNRMALTDSEVYIDFQNSTSLPVYAKLHWFVAKADSKFSPLQEYKDQITARKLYTTDYAFPASAGVRSGSAGNLISQYSARTTAINGSEYLTLPPYHKMTGGSLHTQYRKIGTKTFILGGGDTHRMSIHTVHNQFGIEENFNEELLTWVKGSLVCYLEYQGTAALDTTAGTGTYSLSAGQISAVITRKCHLAPMKAPNKKAVTEFYGNSTVSGSSAIATYKTVTPSVFQNLAAVTQ